MQNDSILDRLGIDEQTYGEILTTPPLFAETLLQSPMNPSEPLVLRPYQWDIMADLSRRKVLRMGRRCVWEHDQVMTSGGYRSAGELFAQRQALDRAIFPTNPQPIYTVTEQHTIQHTSNWDISDNGKVPTMRVEVGAFRRATVSMDHPFLVTTRTGTHWVEAQHLEPGMRVAVLDHLSDGLTFEPVTGLRPFGTVQTYDLHVPGTESFIGNDGIVQHNTGKTVTLGAIALYEAFTSKNKEVMLVTAYDSQIETLFNLMHRMAIDAPLIKNSVARTRRKPHEIWFKNDSVIFGQVASPSVRGKCLVEGTMVWMGDGSWKPIEHVEAGDIVVTLDMETHRPVKTEVRARIDNGYAEVHYLHNASARELVGTKEHPVLTPHGWVPLGNLKTRRTHEHGSDFVAMVNVFGQRLWSRAYDVGQYAGEAHVYDLDVPPHRNFIAMHPRELDYQAFEKTQLSYGGYVVHNSANVLIIDEADYVDQDLLLADIWPIATSFKDTKVVLSSTPTGRREFFWRISTYKSRPQYNFSEHHIPSTSSPEWTPEQEALAREITTKQQFSREYLAEFGEEAEGVFKHSDIDASLAIYGYDDVKQHSKNFYSLGVDWNEPQNGVQAIILEYLNEPDTVTYWSMDALDDHGKKVANKTRREHKKFRVFWSGTIDAEDYDQLKAVDWILEIMRKFRLDYASFDYGHGYTNYQLLRKCIDRGFNVEGKALPKRLNGMLEKMESVNFGSKQEIIDVSTNETSTAKKKNYMVKLAQRVVENRHLIIPAFRVVGELPDGTEERKIVENDERKLVGQMRQYQIERIGATGEIYGTSGVDHKLDAMLLSLYGYGQLNEEFQNWMPGSTARTAPSILQPAIVSAKLLRQHRQMQQHQQVQHTTGPDGRQVHDWGNHPGGDPPESENTGPFSLSTRRRNSRLSMRNVNGFNHTRRTK